jgi:trimeric autotransporter adhesin
MSFTRANGWASYRRFLPILAAIQWMALASAWAQAPATVTTLAIAPATGQQTTVAPGSVITLTAAVTAAGKPVIQGQVNFCDTTPNHCTDVHLLGTAQLTNAGTATLRFVPGVGSHSYTAVFVGTGILAPSTSAAALATVTGTYSTSTSLTASGVPGNYSLNATVVSAGGALPPAGDVGFFDTTNANALLATQLLVPNSTHVTWNGIVESLPNEVVGFAVGDFNGDGRPDVIYAQFGQQNHPNQLAVLFGNGDGTFTPAPQTTSIGVNASQFVIGDFNNDGRQDVALMYFTEQVNNLSIFLGNGDGTFTLASTPAFGIDISNLAVGDFNGDGNEDLAETDGPQLNILFGNGDGTFTLGPTTTSVDFVSFAVGDFNKDGKLDLVCSGQQLTVLLGNGDGTFHEGVSLPGANYPVVADFNGDGILDIAGTVAVTDPTGPMDDGYISIYLGAGDGSFTAAAPLMVMLEPRQIVVGDFNRDGKPDLAVPDFQSNTNSTFLGNGDGTFTASGTVSSGADPASALATADFNGDGAADLLTQYTGIGLAVYLSEPTMTSVATLRLTRQGTQIICLRRRCLIPSWSTRSRWRRWA